MQKLPIIYPQNKKRDINKKTVQNVNNFIRCLHEFKKVYHNSKILKVRCLVLQKIGFYVQVWNDYLT